MTKLFTDYLVTDKSEVHVTFKVTVDSDIRYVPEGIVEFETYGPLFRDDFTAEMANQIDALIEKQMEESGRMERIVGEMIDEMIYV